MQNSINNHPFENSETFDAYFLSVFGSYYSCVPIFGAKCSYGIDDIIINFVDVLNQELNVNTKNSSASDRNPNSSLVRFVLWTFRYRFVTFQKSHKSGIVPPFWNVALI